MTFDNDFGYGNIPKPDREPKNVNQGVPGAESSHENRSLFSLLADLPSLVSSLIRSEIDLLKAELMNKAKKAGLGAVLFAIAIPVIVLAIIVLILSGVFALALVMPTWLAALLVAVALLVLAGILIVFGLLSFKSFGSPMPKRTISSVQEDIDTVTGKNS